MSDSLTVHPYGETALTAVFGDGISEDLYRRVRALTSALEGDPPRGLSELIPAYNSLLVVYDPREAAYEDLAAIVRDRAARSAEAVPGPSRVARIPVCYEPPHAPDLEDVARHAGLSPAEVVSIHSAGAYLVYMLGFTPGFPYLGGLDDRIAAPRRATPRTRIPAGSVGIADRQTGIYPQASPGGWNLIGRTPAILFDPTRTPPALLAAGMYIRFTPISAAEFEDLSAAAASDRWRPEIAEEDRP